MGFLQDLGISDLVADFSNIVKESGLGEMAQEISALKDEFIGGVTEDLATVSEPVVELKDKITGSAADIQSKLPGGGNS